MRGTYRIYQNGKLIAESSNLITTEGKRAILRYLSGHTGAFVKSLCVGTSSVAADVADTKLGFEVARANVMVTSPDYLAQKIVFKATLPQEAAFAVWEIGSLTGAAQDTTGQAIMSFDSLSEPWSNVSFVADTNRIGGDEARVSAALSATTTASLTELAMDFSQYLDNDKFSLAYEPGNANTASVKVRFLSSAGNYFEYTITNPSAGYKVETWNKSAMTKTGTPAWDAITSMEVSVTAKAAGATTVDFDGLRIDSIPDSAMDNILVSRTVLASPVVKLAATQMDIEYVLDVTI